MKYIICDSSGIHLCAVPTLIHTAKDALYHATSVLARRELGETVWVTDEAGRPIAYAAYHDEYKCWLRKYEGAFNRADIDKCLKLYKETAK